MRYSGLRIGDATMLRLDKLDGNRLSLRTEKANKDISVLLPPPVIDALEQFEPTKGLFKSKSEQGRIRERTGTGIP